MVINSSRYVLARIDAAAIERLFGLSNHLLETPWPKVEKGKAAIQDLLKAPLVNKDDLFAILSDETIGPDDQLPDTGVGLERERLLSPAFIKSPGYGTRCSTVIMVDYNDNAAFYERAYHPETAEYSLQSFQFAIGAPAAEKK